MNRREWIRKRWSCAQFASKHSIHVVANHEYLGTGCTSKRESTVVAGCPENERGRRTVDRQIMADFGVAGRVEHTKLSPS